MELTSAPDEASLEEFRTETRDWLQRHTPEGWEELLARADEQEALSFYRRWAAELHSAGLLVPHWPARFGGGERSVAEQMVIHEEMALANAPRPRYLAIALGHAAMTLMEHGTPEQQELLKGILAGEVWCQGFSEPNAGSDLASLRTRAVRTGDHYLVNGQKIWSSMARVASWCLLLARTDADAPKHKGISLFLLDLSSPGVELRPIRQPTGTAEFCEIFLSDVRIPASMRVGAENEGWTIAQTTLTTERIAQMVEMTAGLRKLIRRLASEATTTLAAPGAVVADDAAFRQELAARSTEVEVLALLTEKVLDDLVRHGRLGPETSILKLFLSQTMQRLSQLGVRTRGVASQLDAVPLADVSYTTGDWMADHIRSWVWTIAAGTSEIQKNIIGERVLGLPRERPW